MGAAVEQLNTAITPKATFLLLTKESAESWRLMPEYLERVKRFCARNPYLNTDKLIKNVTLDFIDDQHFFCLPVILRDGKMVGHGLFQICRYNDGQFAQAMQADLDPKAAVDFNAIDGLVYALEQWCRDAGCVGAESWVEEGPQERRMRIFHGFERYRIVMRKRISE